MYNGIFRYFTGIIILFHTVSCEQKPDFEKIYSELPEDRVLQIDTSIIFAKFALPVKNIESKINSSLGISLYSDDNYENRNGVKIKLNIDRTGEIILSGTKDKLFYKVPVKVKGRILINESILGVKIRAEPGFELNLTLNLASQLSFYRDFQYAINTKIEEIYWPRKPVIKAGPIKVDLTEAIEAVILSNEKFLSEIIDRTAKSEIDLKDLIVESASDIPKFNYIKNKDIDLWMEISPLNMIIEKQLKIENDTITVKAGLNTLLSLSSQKGDSSFISTTDLKLVALSDIPDNFKIVLKVKMSYASLDTLLQKEIKRKGLTNILPDGITINNLKTGKWDDNSVFLKAEVDGKLKGELVNRGELQFDSLSNSIYLKNMDSDFYSDNWVWSLFYKIYFPGLKSQVEDKIKWPLDPLFIKVQMAVDKLFKKLSNEGELKIEFSDLDYRIKEFNLQKDEIELLIEIEGQTNFNFTYKKSPS